MQKALLYEYACEGDYKYIKIIGFNTIEELWLELNTNFVWKKSGLSNIKDNIKYEVYNDIDYCDIKYIRDSAAFTCKFHYSSWEWQLYDDNHSKSITYNDYITRKKLSIAISSIIEVLDDNSINTYDKIDKISVIINNDIDKPIITKLKEITTDDSKTAYEKIDVIKLVLRRVEE